jgi:hypothetical protein
VGMGTSESSRNAPRLRDITKRMLREPADKDFRQKISHSPTGHTFASAHFMVSMELSIQCSSFPIAQNFALN